MSPSFDPPPGFKLNPAAVRERARGVLGCKEIILRRAEEKKEEAEDATLNVLSFLVGLPTGTLDLFGTSAERLARVNVFCASGTIGTQRILDNKVRQVFRRNVSSLDVVERLLRHPEQLLVIDEQLVGVHDEEQEPMLARTRQQKSVQKELELADVAVCILEGEKEKLNRHLEYLDQREQELQDEDEVDSLSDHSVSNLEFQFRLPADIMAQVDQCLHDISKMNKIVTYVATNGKGTVFLYGNGGVAYTPGIPKALYHRLRDLRHSTMAARPSYVALGTRERYYVAFHDGTADWKGPKALDKILKKSAPELLPPRCVTFGSTYDTFFIVFADGSWEYQGRGIPDALEEKLAARDHRADLVVCHLGPTGEEWFVKATNGRMWWSGVEEDLDAVLQGIVDHDHQYLHSIDFGENGSYFVTYEEDDDDEQDSNEQDEED